MSLEELAAADFGWREGWGIHAGAGSGRDRLVRAAVSVQVTSRRGFSDRHIALSVFAFDDEMIVTPHLANLAGHESPTFHVRRCQQDGIFDRFTTHVSALWDEARPVRDVATSA